MASVKHKMSPKAPELKDYQTVTLKKEFQVEILPSPTYEELSDEKKHLIKTIWEKEQKRREGKLFEGKVLSAVSFDKNKLSAQFVPYKYFLAQRFDPSLKQDLKIVPVSLSGMTFIQDSIVIAKRSHWVAEFPKHFELAPSGSVQFSDRPFSLDVFKEQFLGELKEEIGVEPQDVKKFKFIAIVKDEKLDALELFGEIHLKNTSVFTTSSEYSQVITFSKNELPNFVKKYGNEFVPISLFLLKWRKLI